jgi:signal transduction histidine kinase
MTAGDLTARTAITSGDEVGTLAQSFNKMATRVEETIVTLRRFVADAAHELHTPLTALRTNLELLASEPSDLQRFAFAEQALAQVQRLETLTTDLLELSRLEAITSPAQKKPVNLTRMIQETSELYASQAEQLEIAFQLDMPHDDIIVTADETQIRHALCNLLENALKFTPSPGSIGAGITCNNSGHLEIWVQDTGIGIPDDDLPQLFSRFHRGRNAAAYPGSGLGLAIVKAITDAHNGSITAEPLPSGTRFTLRLPAA